jgi:hypothetical protein
MISLILRGRSELQRMSEQSSSIAFTRPGMNSGLKGEVRSKRTEASVLIVF